MTIEKIIILEGDTVHRSQLENYLRRQQCDVAIASNPRAARELLCHDDYDILFIELPADPHARDENREFLKELIERTQDNNHPQSPLIITTSSPTNRQDSDRTHGPFESLLKPYTEENVVNILHKAAEITQLQRVNGHFSHDTGDEEHQILGDSPETEALRHLIYKIARTQATVLIQGESGTGKEAVARAIHRQSSRNRAPYIRVNCAAIPENLIESEFFGHEKGAFTGAAARRQGRFELAHGGTLLLDEISEISPQLQAKLLRVLQEREFERVGGNRTIRVDVRVIATTNRDLRASVARKEFRQDLYYRLNVVPVEVKPLRERRGDIPALQKEFLRRFNRKHAARVKGFTDEAGKLLLNHAWPGNVRELQNVVERAVILCNENELIGPGQLGLGGADRPRAEMPGGQGHSTFNFQPSTLNLAEEGEFLTLAEVERRHILTALEYCGNNRTHAAQLLKMSARTLRSKLVGQAAQA
jgi:DNA-binding NtrC family response regulator